VVAVVDAAPVPVVEVVVAAELVLVPVEPAFSPASVRPESLPAPPLPPLVVVVVVVPAVVPVLAPLESWGASSGSPPAHAAKGTTHKINHFDERVIVISFSVALNLAGTNDPTSIRGPVDPRGKKRTSIANSSRQRKSSAAIIFASERDRRGPSKTSGYVSVAREHDLHENGLEMMGF
jgi:hypothetical protein